MYSKEVEKILLKVQKPGRYTGGELNCVIKDKEKVDLRFAFCFPDTYEIGMSHLGSRILYNVLNSREDTICERAFAPWPDMEEQLKKEAKMDKRSAKAAVLMGIAECLRFGVTSVSDLYYYPDATAEAVSDEENADTAADTAE